MKNRWVVLFVCLCLLVGLVACSGGSKTVEKQEPKADQDASQEQPSDDADPAADESSERKILKVGLEGAYPPLNWTQTDDANGALPLAGQSDYVNGYDITIAKLFAEQYGYELELRKIDWDGLVMAVQSGVVDCVISGQSITEQRKQSVDFTDPYYKAGIVVLTRKDSAFANAKGISELKGAKASSQLASLWYEILDQTKEYTDILPPIESAPQMLVSLDSGAVDIITTDKPYAIAAMKVHPNFVMLDFSGNPDDDFKVEPEDIDLGISVQKGNQELLDQFNEFLAGISEDERHRMLDEAASVQPINVGDE